MVAKVHITGPSPASLEVFMKKFIALALVSSFALVAFAAEDKKPEPKKEKACSMACCQKNKAASCKDCPDCSKKKADAPKKN
jgi:hypothetical protein